MNPKKKFFFAVCATSYKNFLLQMDSDSDSDSDIEVVPAKRPMTTRRKLVPIKNVEDADRGESIYLSKVDLSMKAMNQQTTAPVTNTSGNLN